MREVTLTKCKLCGHYYESDRKHKCKQSERFSYNQGKEDGFRLGVDDTRMRIDVIRLDERAKTIEKVRDKLFGYGFIITRQQEDAFAEIVSDIMNG